MHIRYVDQGPVLAQRLVACGNRGKSGCGLAGLLELADPLDCFFTRKISSLTEQACLEQRICFEFWQKTRFQNSLKNRGLTPVPGVFVGVNEGFLRFLISTQIYTK